MSIIDTLGPIMIGPSSSHTAGACRLGKVCRDIVAAPFHCVVFYLHGSFAHTYHGHGTDRALVAGVLGMEPDDPRLINSFAIAKERGLEYSFVPTDLGYVHPNTVKIVFTMDDGKERVIIGSSIGGGAILIKELDGIPVRVRAEKPTVVVKYHDQKGIINAVTDLLLEEKINIASMEVTRNRKEATMIVEMDEQISSEVYKKVESIPGVTLVATIQGVKDALS